MYRIAINISSEQDRAMNGRQAEGDRHRQAGPMGIQASPLAEHIDKRMLVHDLALLAARVRRDGDDGYQEALDLASSILREHRGQPEMIVGAYRAICSMPMEDRMLLVKREYEVRLCEIVEELGAKVAEMEAKARRSRIGFGNF